MSGPAPRVVETSLERLVSAYEAYCEEPYGLGRFVVVREGSHPVIGVVVASRSGPEDPTRSLQPRGDPGQTGAEVMRDHPEIRLLLRTELTVVACGYFRDGTGHGGLPPVPPPLLAAVELATPEELAGFLTDCSFLERLVADGAVGDSAIVAALRAAAEALGGAGRGFKVQAGKELARLLRADPARLGTILRGIADDR